MKNVFDKSGRPVQPGDIIVYGHALGRCAGLQYGKVLAITLKPKDPWDGGRRAKGVNFTVQGVSWDWEQTWAPTLLKKGTLQFWDRLLVVTREQVPTKVLALLDTVTPETKR